MWDRPAPVSVLKSLSGLNISAQLARPQKPPSGKLDERDGSYSQRCCTCNQTVISLLNPFIFSSLTASGVILECCDGLIPSVEIPSKKSVVKATKLVSFQSSYDPQLFITQLHPGCHQLTAHTERPGRARCSHLDDLPGLHGQRGEVPAAMDRDALAQDGVQTLHLIPRQHADPPTLITGIAGGHDDAGGGSLDVRGA